MGDPQPQLGEPLVDREHARKWPEVHRFSPSGPSIALPTSEARWVPPSRLKGPQPFQPKCNIHLGHMRTAHTYTTLWSQWFLGMALLLGLPEELIKRELGDLSPPCPPTLLQRSSSPFTRSQIPSNPLFRLDTTITSHSASIYWKPASHQAGV